MADSKLKGDKDVSSLLRSSLLERYVEQYTIEVSQRLVDYSLPDVMAVCDSLSDKTCAKLLAQLPDSISDSIIERSDNTRLIAWLSEAQPREAIVLAARIPPQRLEVLTRENEIKRVALERIRGVQARNLGHLVRRDFIRIDASGNQQNLVTELRSVRNTGQRPVFVTDANGHYMGIIGMHAALTAVPETPLNAIYHYVRPLAMSASVQQITKSGLWQEHRELPVIDEQGVLVGSIVWQDLQAFLLEQSDSGQPADRLTPVKALELFVRALAPILTFAWPYRDRK